MQMVWCTALQLHGAISVLHCKTRMFATQTLVVGCLLVVSTHSKEIHEEVHSYQCLDCCIVDMAYCVPLNKAGERCLASPCPAASHHSGLQHLLLASEQLDELFAVSLISCQATGVIKVRCIPYALCVAFGRLKDCVRVHNLFSLHLVLEFLLHLTFFAHGSGRLQCNATLASLQRFEQLVTKNSRLGQGGPTWQQQCSRGQGCIDVI